MPSELPKAYGIIAPVSTTVLPVTSPAIARAVSTMVSVPCVTTICDSGACRQFLATIARSASVISRLSTSMTVRIATSTLDRPRRSISGTCDSVK